MFAYIVDGTPEELQSAIDITLQRFAEYQSLQGAFGRRALIEQAKGILMARHGVDADRAFEMLRDHSQHNGRKLSDVADAVVESHSCYCRRSPSSTPVDGDSPAVQAGLKAPASKPDGYRRRCSARFRRHSTPAST